MTCADLVAFAEGLSQIAAAGGGAKGLAEFFARRTGAGVVLEDAQQRALAVCRDGVASEAQGRSLEVCSGELRLGQITIFAADPPAVEHAARLTAAAIAVELAREATAQPKRRDIFWERLAGAQYVDAAAARDDAAARGVSLAEHYVAIALEFETSVRAQREIAQALRNPHGEPALLEQGNALLYFVPAPREIDGANARTAASRLPRTLGKTHPGAKLSGGVGTRVPLIETPRSLAQARAALTIGRRMYGGGHVGAYDDLGAYPLLFNGANADELRAFAAARLAPLRSYDEKHQTELERTLRLYFNVGENVKTAAEQLFVHRHTVFYRLRQIGEICGCKLDDPHDQLTLRMAMAIDALTNERV